MGRRRWRGPWLRRKRGRGVSGWGQLALSVLLGLALALLLIHRLDGALRPQLVALAQAQIKNQLTHIADRAVTEALGDPAELVTIRTGESGGVSTLTTNAAGLNALRAAVLEDIVTQVEALDSRSLGVPLGAVTGIDLLSALGPALPVRVLSVASAEGQFRNEFTSAGINQTLHRVMLDVTVTAKLLLPGGVEEAVVSTPVRVAETVIIGQVPQTYLNWDP